MGAIPVGFRFHPTEEEIISHYLRLRINGCDFNDIIPEIDLYQWEPCDLPHFSPIRSGDQVWYFFCRLDYKKYPNSKRSQANRAVKTGTGCWKVTGKVRDIKARGTDEVIGTKKTLVFYYKFPNTKAARTSWVIHEYHAEITLPDLGVLVLCKLKNKADGVSDNSPCDDGEPSCLAASDVDILTPRVRIIEVDKTPVEPYIYTHPPCLLQPEIQAEQGLSNDEIRFADSFLDVPDDYFNENTALALPNRHTQFASDAYVGATFDTGTMVVRARSIPEVFPFSTEFTEPGSIEINRVEIVGEALPRIHKEPEIPRAPEKPKTLRSFKNFVQGRALSGRLVPECKMSNTLLRDKDGESTKHGNVVDLWQKFDVESEKDSNMLMVFQAKSDIKSQSSTSAGTDWRGPFIHMEMPPSSQTPSPPLVYLLKALLGLVLLIFFVMELLILH